MLSLEQRRRRTPVSLLSTYSHLSFNNNDNAHRSRPPRLPRRAGGAGPRGARGRGTATIFSQTSVRAIDVGSFFASVASLLRLLLGPLGLFFCSDMQIRRGFGFISSEGGSGAGQERGFRKAMESRRGQTEATTTAVEKEKMLSSQWISLVLLLRGLSLPLRPASVWITVLVLYGSSSAVNNSLLASSLSPPQ